MGYEVGSLHGATAFRLQTIDFQAVAHLVGGCSMERPYVREAILVKLTDEAWASSPHLCVPLLLCAPSA